MNQYVFCANNPVNFSDSLGLLEWYDTKELAAEAALVALEKAMPMAQDLLLKSGEKKKVRPGNEWWARSTSEGFSVKKGKTEWKYAFAPPRESGVQHKFDVNYNCPGLVDSYHGHTCSEEFSEDIEGMGDQAVANRIGGNVWLLTPSGVRKSLPPEKKK